ncbi:FtsX-like permease family protein [Chungangia koreensis]|uniref:FtsX-like permease family protein n=1 Tax=Chungangia koreensis TaxID=752657 RepID=A0ABV8X6X7_9LACT
MTFRQFAYRNVIRNRRLYAAYFLASVVSVMVFFIYSMLLFHPMLDQQLLRNVAVGGMVLAEIILYLFMLFFLFYSMSAFLEARSKEFGILLHLGMSKRQLNKLIFVESMLIGIASIFMGIGFGYAFSKFFLMIIREILQIDSLPLYFSWEPFALTIGAFLSLFTIISFTSVVFIRTRKIVNLIRGSWKTDSLGYSKIKAFLGIGLLLFGYVLAIFVTRANIAAFAVIIPLLALMGTYFFFTHTVLLLLELVRKRKKTYYRDARLLSLVESAVKLRESARMFFIVTIVSTLAFLSVGALASFTSYTAQYRELHPLSLIYTSQLNNPFENRHIHLLTSELEKEQLSYSLNDLLIKKQTSSFSEQPVHVLKASEVNSLAASMGFPLILLEQGEAVFLPYSKSSIEDLEDYTVQTVLKESKVPVTVQGVYPFMLFPDNAISTNAIIINDLDYRLIDRPFQGSTYLESFYKFYAFHVPDWQRTKSIGLEIEQIMTRAFMSGTEDSLPFTFDNPGLNYSIIRSTFSLLLFIGLMVAAVFLLAAGSFIYFKLYTNLEADKKQFAVLRRIGLTDREFVKIANRQLIPQFFLPWGIAMLHSSFAFLTLQALWKVFADVNILNEMVLVLVGFTIIQITYFYLIRWRYLAHVRA